MYFQEITSEKIADVSMYPLRVIGSLENTRISGGLQALSRNCSSTYFVFLELDFIIDKDLDGTFVRNELTRAYETLKSKCASFYYLRNRQNPGSPNYAYDSLHGREMDHIRATYGGNQTHVCYYHYWIKDPVLDYPTHFSHCYTGYDEVVCTLSRYCAFTNNPFMVSRSFFESNIDPYLTRMRNTPQNDRNYANLNLVEPFMTDNREPWLEKDYMLAHGKGIFTHYNSKL